LRGGGEEIRSQNVEGRNGSDRNFQKSSAENIMKTKILLLSIVTLICFGPITLFAQYTGGNGGGYSSGTSSQGALPVELVSFAANVKDNTVNLHWRTATEINNFGFDVERRVGKGAGEQGRNGDTENRGNGDSASGAGWEKVGFVEGAGTSNSPREYVFVDRGLTSDVYAYRLKQLDRDGRFRYSHSVEVEVVAIPKAFLLEQNFPNPFNPITTIRYGIPTRSQIKIEITNTLGQRIATLVNTEQQAGYYEIRWGASAASGIYFYRLEAVAVENSDNRFVQMRKMILVK
jgi:hypothetical protein